MDNFKEASKQKLRFITSRGSLTTEQLWDLPLEELDNLAVSLEAEHKQSAKKSFLDKTSTKDKTAKLKFDIVLDILNTKVEEANALTEAKEIKEHNKKIIELIAEKKDESLKGKSIKELEKMLK
jgi:hypothetical protein